MKLGHFMALLLLALAVVSGAFLYWDLQDESFYPRLVMMPVFGVLMAGAFALFPGNATTLQQVRTAPAPGLVQAWLADSPPLHRRVWLGSFLLSFALGLGLSDYLQGKPVFELSSLIIEGLVMLGMGYFVSRRFSR